MLLGTVSPKCCGQISQTTYLCILHTRGLYQTFFLLVGCIQLALTIYRTGFHSQEEKFGDFRAQLTQILPYFSYNLLSISSFHCVDIEAENPLKIYEWPILFIFSRRLRKSMLKMTYDNGWARKCKVSNLTFRCCFEPSRQNAVVKFPKPPTSVFYIPGVSIKLVLS